MNLSTHCHAVTKVEQTKVSWPYVPLFGLSRASALLHTLYSKKLVRRNSGLCKCGHGEKLVIYTRSLIWRRDIFIISTLLTTKRLSSRYTLATSSPIGYLKFLGRTDNWVTVKLTLWEWQISFLDANIHALLVQAVTLDSLPRPITCYDCLLFLVACRQSQLTRFFMLPPGHHSYHLLSLSYELITCLSHVPTIPRLHWKLTCTRNGGRARFSSQSTSECRTEVGG